MCKPTCKAADMLAAAEATIDNLKTVRDNQFKTISKYQDLDKHHLERIAELEACCTDRWEQIQRLERKVSGGDALISELRDGLDRRGTAHASDRIELEARREECEKLKALLAQMTRWRDTAAEQCDKLDRKLINMTENYGFQRDRAAKLGCVTNNQSREIIGLNGTVADVRRQLAEMTTDRNQIAEKLADLVELHDAVIADMGESGNEDELQEALANLHKAGKAVLKYELKMSTALVPFIESLTRAGDLLEELTAPMPTTAPKPQEGARIPPVPASDKDW